MHPGINITIVFLAKSVLQRCSLGQLKRCAISTVECASMHLYTMNICMGKRVLCLFTIIMLFSLVHGRETIALGHFIRRKITTK